MSERAYQLDALDPLEVQAALRASEYDDEADAIGFITAIGAPDEQSLGYGQQLRAARQLGTSYSLPEAVRQKASDLYADLRALHEAELRDVERSATDFLTRRPGVLHVASLLSPSDREPLVTVEFVDAQAKPYQEASLALHGLHGVVSGNVWDRDVRCDVTKLPKRVKKFILKRMIAEEA